MILSDAIRLFESEMRRQQWTSNAQDRYSRELKRFALHVGDTTPIRDLDARVCRSFLDTFTEHAPSTVGLECSILSTFFKTMALDELIDANPMDKIKRPKVPALRDRERVRVSTEQVQTMLAACETWPEILCLNTLALMGVRKTALSNLRWRDVDAKRWTALFHEKGRKRISKPVPHQLRAIWMAYAHERAAAGKPIHGDEWVVPNRRELGHTSERSSTLIYHIVKGVAKRCEIKAHVHSLRAAFAVHFLRSNPAQLESLRQLMGHSSIATTQGYLDELESVDSMRVVESLSFGEAA